MRRIGFFALCMLLLMAGLTRAQDGMDLPPPLYLLTNNGQVQRIGLAQRASRSSRPRMPLVVDFGVAPDGIWLAYRTEKGLYILNIYSAEAATIEEGTADLPPSRGHGDTLAWSPTGDMLVYTTAYGARVYILTHRLRHCLRICAKGCSSICSGHPPVLTWRQRPRATSGGCIAARTIR